MNHQELLERYVELCAHAFAENARAQSMLRSRGVTDTRILESFRIGYADGNVSELTGDQAEVTEHFGRLGILSGTKERLKGRITIPIRDPEGGIVNVVGFALRPNVTHPMLSLSEEGIFNAPYLRHQTETIICEEPIQTLLLIQNGISNATFAFGDDAKYARFFQDHGVRKIVFTFEGRARLFHELRNMSR
jgi:DNA primase